MQATTNYETGKQVASDPTGRMMESTLEGMVDRAGVRAVLSALANVCNGKAAHLLEAWQDSSTSASWEKVEAGLDRVRSKAQTLGLH